MLQARIALIVGLLLAPVEAIAHHGVDAFLGGGINGDPTSDDFSGHAVLGAGVRPGPNLSLGTNLYFTSFGGHKRYLIGAHGKIHILPTWPVRPYGLLGLGFLDMSGGDQPRGTEWRLMPKIGIGAEIGWPSVAIFGEISHQTQYAGTSDITSLTAGLNIRFSK